MRPLSSQLIYLTAMLIQQSIDFILVHKNSSPINYGILNVLNLVNIELLVSFVIFTTLINIASIILKFVYIIQTQYFEVIQLFTLPISIVSSAIIFKNAVDNQSPFPIEIVFALIISIFHQLIKITSFSNRNNIQISYIYAKIVPYFNIFLIIKMCILSYGPFLIDPDLAVGFALVINILKTIIFALKINMEQANIEYIIGISSLWGWFHLLKYLLLILDINTIFISVAIPFYYFAVIYKPSYLITLLQFKYRPLFQQLKDTVRENDIPRASLILREFYSIHNERPIQWSKDFTLTIRKFVYDKQIQEQGVSLHDVNQIQTMKSFGNRNLKEDPQKIDKITDMLWNFFMSTNKFYVQDYFYLGIYLCYMFPVKESNNMLNKLFKLFYTMKFSQKQISFLEQVQLQFCYYYLNQRLSRESLFKKYFYMQSVINDVLHLFYQFYNNEQRYFDLLSFSKADHLQIKAYLLKKNQIRQSILEKMNQYRITQSRSNMCLIVDYMIECYFNRNRNKGKQFLSQELKKRFKGRTHALTKSYLVTGQTMLGLISGTKMPGKIIYSNNVFKQQLQIKNQKFSKNSEKAYNIHDFMPQFYREKHQTAVNQFSYDNTPQHSNEKCFLLSSTHNMMRVRVKISFFYDYLDDLKICIEMKKIEDKSYAIYNQSYELIYLSKVLGAKQQFKQNFIQNSSNNVNSYQKTSIYKNQSFDYRNLKSLTKQDSLQGKGIKNKVVQIFGKIFFIERFAVQGIKSNPKLKWMQFLKKEGKSTNFEFNFFNFKTEKSSFEQINYKKEDAFYKCRQKISFLSSKLSNLILIFVILLLSYIGFMIGVQIRHSTILQQKTQVIQTTNAIQTKYLTNQIFNSLDFGFNQEYHDLMMNHPQLMAQYQFVPTILNQSIQENIHNFNAVQNKFLTTSSNILQLIFSQSQKGNSIFKDVIGFYGKYLQSIPYLSMDIEHQKIQNITQNNFLDSQLAEDNYRSVGGLKQIITKMSQKFDSNFNLNIKIIYFLFASILILLYIVYVFSYYNIRKSTNQLLELTLNINKTTYKSLYVEAECLINLLKKISQVSQSRLVRQLQNSGTNVDEKIIKQSQTLCTLNSQKQIKLPLSIQMKTFTILTFICIGFVIAGIIFHSFFVLNRIQTLNDAKMSLEGLNNVTIDFTKTMKQLYIAKHHYFPQRNSSQQYQNLSNKLIKNADLLFIRKIFSKQESDEILYTNLCKNNPEKWNCLDFMYQKNTQLKPLISSCISLIRLMSFNTFIPQHILHGTAQGFIASYNDLLMLKTINQRVSLQAFKFLKEQNGKDYNLRKIIIISFVLFCLYSLFNIILLSGRVRIFQKQVFKLTSFENIIHMQKYLYYVNYFYSHQTQIEEQ